MTAVLRCPTESDKCNLTLNVKVAGAARLYRAASVLMDGLKLMAWCRWKASQSSRQRFPCTLGSEHIGLELMQ